MTLMNSTKGNNHSLNTRCLDIAKYGSTSSTDTCISERQVDDNTIIEENNTSVNLQDQTKDSDKLTKDSHKLPDTCSHRQPAQDKANTTSTINRFRSFVVLFCSSISIFAIVGIGASMTIFFPAWLEEFQDGRFQTAVIPSLLQGLTHGFGVMTGFIIKKFDVKLTMCVGAVMVTVGCLAAAFAPSTIVLILTVGLLAGIGSSCIYLAGMVVVSRSFDKHASIALSFTVACSSFGTAVFPYLLDVLMNHYGWRRSFYFIAGISVQIVWLSFVATSLTDKLTEQSVAEDASCGGFAQLCHHQCITICIAAFVTYGVHKGFCDILADYSNITNINAVLYLFLMGICNVVFNIVCSALTNCRWIDSFVLLSVFIIVTGGALNLLALADNSIHRLVLIVLLGICKGGSVGMVTVAPIEFTGPDNYALTFGIINTLKGIGTIVVGPLYGLLYDVTRSYNTVFTITGCVTCFFGLLPVLSFVANKLKRKQ